MIQLIALVLHRTITVLSRSLCPPDVSMTSRGKERTEKHVFFFPALRKLFFSSFIAGRMSLRLSSLDNEELIHNVLLQDYLLALEIHLNENPTCINRFFRRNQCHWTLPYFISILCIS
jgi:hypothetical protein